MKKFLSLALALIMVLSLAACGNKETPSTDDTPNDNQQTETTKGLTTEERSKEFITVGTGPTSGIYFPIGGAFATAMNRQAPYV